MHQLRFALTICILALAGCATKSKTATGVAPQAAAQTAEVPTTVEVEFGFPKPDPTIPASSNPKALWSGCLILEEGQGTPRIFFNTGSGARPGIAVSARYVTTDCALHRNLDTQGFSEEGKLVQEQPGYWQIFSFNTPPHPVYSAVDMVVYRSGIRRPMVVRMHGRCRLQSDMVPAGQHFGPRLWGYIYGVLGSERVDRFEGDCDEYQMGNAAEAVP